MAPFLYAHYPKPWNSIAKNEAYSVRDLIQGRSMLLIDDSIVRGTQLRESPQNFYQSGAVRYISVRMPSAALRL